tara:strand:+ start:5742 stop:6164 length:423 start_codon:yes stop_codon:yes gene_type:complete
MDKEQLKKILKPLIKECIKEVIFEDGTLSTVISEVVKGLGQPLIEVKASVRASKSKKMQLETDDQAKARRNKLQENRNRIMDSVGRDAYNGVNLFEGTTPAPSAASNGYGALKDMAPHDAGVDISSLMGASRAWKKLAGK